MKELDVGPGQKISTAWLNLQKWIQKNRHNAPGAIINYTSNGATVLFEQEEYALNIYLRVTLIGKKIIVGDGTVNGKVPTYNSIPVTGRKTPPTPPPQIPLGQPNENGDLMVCVKTTHDTSGKMTAAEIDTKTPESLPNGMRADYISGANGFIPIAIVRHDIQTREPVSVFQVSVHNLQCRMYNSSGGRRVLYWPA